MSHSITIAHEENPVNSKPCISKVHIGLRNVKPKAYEPVLVSIGPYHKANPHPEAKKQKGKPDLQAMQQNKESYLNLLLKRRNESPESREIYLAELKKFDREARNCYVDPVDSNTDDFAEMMLLDGCFIVEFLRKMDRDVEEVEFDKDDPIKRVPWMQDQILSDMMLLENQLPYFVLSEVYNMTKSVGEKLLEEMVMSCFNFMLPRPRLNSNNAFGNKRFNHLLHLIHVLCHPLPKNPTMSTVRTTCFSFFCERIIAKIWGIKESSDDQTRCPLLPQNNDSGSDESYEMKNQMGTVVELQEAGIKFKKVGKIYNGELKKEKEEDEEEDKSKKVCKIFNCALKKKTEDDYVSLFDIDFKCGVMKVPCFKVDDTTETLLRNLIAYEQHFEDVCPKYFTDFACLMNQLINSKEDAKILRFEEIIMNFLGDEDELSELFNKLSDGVCESYKPYDHKVRTKVDKHCKTNCNVLMAKLRRDYFNNPWAGISTFAAVLLLLLTVGQFVIALYTLLA